MGWPHPLAEVAHGLWVSSGSDPLTRSLTHPALKIYLGFPVIFGVINAMFSEIKDDKSSDVM